MPNLVRVQQEIAEGRLWKARDRLLGMLSTYPTSQEVLELLGDIFYKMGDLPEAGRYWYLTERTDERVQKAFEAYHDQCGSNPYVMLNQLPLKEHFRIYGSEGRANFTIEISSIFMS